jgi:molybdopterin biosynthesis enzyme
MLASPHFLIPGFCWSSTVLFYDEIRKIFLRSGLRKEEGRIKYIGWVARNQYY